MRHRAGFSRPIKVIMTNANKGAEQLLAEEGFKLKSLIAS
jgi:hypothetical protein